MKFDEGLKILHKKISFNLEIIKIAIINKSNQKVCFKMLNKITDTSMLKILG